MRGFLVLCLVLAGCASEPIKLDAPGEQQIRPKDVVQIAIAASDRERLDPYVNMFNKTTASGTARTGEIWSKVFIGDETKHPVFTIKSGLLRETLAGGGFTIRYTYTVEGELIVGGASHTIHAEGTRAAALETFSARRQAVELGIIDAAEQARRIAFKEVVIK
jgi:hypothetical protein